MSRCMNGVELLYRGGFADAWMVEHESAGVKHGGASRI